MRFNCGVPKTPTATAITSRSCGATATAPSRTRRRYLIPHLAPGLSLLDVGCGPGTITVDLAERIAPGRVVGIDFAADAIAAAERTRHAASEFRTSATSTTSTLPTATFDIVHAHQVLQHLTDPVAALREMKRVLKPGGIVAARDSIYSSKNWYPADPMLDRWLELYHQLTDANNAEDDAGVFLPHWAAEAGFDDVAFSGSMWAYADPASRGMVGRPVGRPRPQVVLRDPVVGIWVDHPGRTRRDC